jgi:CRISPR system Cascade subunit CasE
MFLSKLIPNVRNRLVRRELAAPYELHRTLWRAFPDGGPGRVLFRIDSDRSGSRSTILVQSELEPDWARINDRDADYFLASPACRPLDIHFVVRQRLRFRLRANPVKRAGKSAAADLRFKRIGLLCEKEQIAWLLRKGDAGGFRVPGEWIPANDPVNGEPTRLPNFRVDVIPEGWVRCDKEGHECGQFLAVRFEGVLEVVDPEVFLNTIAKGIGTGKAFGFGLLSLAPPHE